MPYQTLFFAIIFYIKQKNGGTENFLINKNSVSPYLCFNIYYFFSSQWNGSKLVEASFHEGLRMA